MTREWEPGDVAMVTLRHKGESEESTYTAFYCGKYGWYGVKDGEGCGGLTSAEDYWDIERRPLVVIDPEDREQLSEFAAALMDAGSSCEHGPRCPEIACLRLTVADALRSLIEPPKPPEPTGLGAVVECSDSRHFIRTRNADSRFPWVLAEKPDGNAYNWTTHGGLDGSTPVRVLSEGVQP